MTERHESTFLMTPADRPCDVGRVATCASGKLQSAFWREAWGFGALAAKCVPTPLAASTMRAGFKLVATKEHDEYGKRHRSGERGSSI